MENFRIVRVVTRDVVTDFFQGIRNFFGFRLRGYEKILDRSIKEMFEEMDLRYKVEWYRLIVNDLSANSAMVIIYGRGVKNE
jgi:hypothetical protein